MGSPIHWRLPKDKHLPKNGNLQVSFLEIHLSSQRQLCYEENMCNYSVSQESWAHNSLNPKEVSKVSLHALFSKGTTEHWPCCFFLYFVPPRCFRREILEFFQLTTFKRFNKRGSSQPMTRQLAVPNGALLTTPQTHRQSFLYVSLPSADPPVLWY